MNIKSISIVWVSVIAGVFVQGSVDGGEPVTFRRGGNEIEVLIAGRPFASYHFDPAVAKPYVGSIRSPHGTLVTREFPMTTIAGEDQDEPHQRAMYFAHGDIDGFDFWGEAAFPRWSRHPISKFGRTVVRTISEMRDGPDHGTIRAEFDLTTPNGAIGEETQTYTFRGNASARTIDCEFAIHANRGPITMGDTKEGTFAIRVAKALDSPPGHMVSSSAALGEKGIWGKRAEWVDYYGDVAGEEVGIAVFDHPENFRFPTYWHARAYGLVAANPFGLKSFTHDSHQDGSYRIPPAGTLAFRYRVVIHHGDPVRAGVQEAYREFARTGR